MSFPNLLKYTPDNIGPCPHCGTVVKFLRPRATSGSPDYPTALSVVASAIVKDDKAKSFMDSTHIVTSECPACHRLITLINPHHQLTAESLEIMAWPIGTRRPPVDPHVPVSIREDYEEAARVLPLSAKASAALSRRCLQHVLKDAGRTKADWLADQINELKQSLPSEIGDNLDYVRTIGKFAAHPEKSKATGEIIEVEDGEAEWNLDVLDALFDHYYARPARERNKREEFDKKLKSLGKKPISS